MTPKRQHFDLLARCAGLVLVLACAFTGVASAQWRASGTIAASGNNGQSRAVTAHDGAGGVYVVWEDLRNNGVNNGLIDVYAQHLLASGAVDPAWNPAGVAVGSGPNYQRAPSIIPDGAGGAFVAWSDRRGGSTHSPYMQHLLRSGVDPAWPANGRLLSTATDNFTIEISMVRDAGTGVLAACSAPGFVTQHYVQHVLANGTLDANFTATGCLAGSTTVGLTSAAIVSDAAGGAVVAWHGDTGGIYAMHVRSIGVKDALWPAAGRNLVTSGSSGADPVAIPDQAGGAIVAWSQVGVSTRDIYARRVRSDGVLDTNYPTGGLVVCDAPGSQQTPSITSDGGVGAFVTWQDFRTGADFDVYAQHIVGGGSVDLGWPATGRAITTATGNQTAFGIVPDSFGGAIVLWYDTGGPLWNVMAQRIGGNSIVDFSWPATGAMVTTPYPTDFVAGGCSSDSLGGAIMAWSRLSGGTSYEILIRKIPYLGTHRITVTPFTGGNVFLSDPDSLQMSSVDITPAEITDFRFAPLGGNYVNDVNVSGVSQGVPPNVRFSNVTLDRTLTVSFASAPWPVEKSMPGVSYVSLGLPLAFADSSVSTLLADLWPADDSRWRLAHWDPISARYVFASDSLGKLQAGAGYWLATMSPRVVSVQGAPIAAASVSLPLLGGVASGWNQIANPYRFPIADSALRVAITGFESPFLSFANTSTDHLIWDWAGGSSYIEVHTLQPNRSYWVRKLLDGAATLKFPNRSSIGPATAAPSLPSGAQWAVGMVARQGADTTSLIMAGELLPSADAVAMRREAPPQSPQGGLSLHIGQRGDGTIRQMTDLVPSQAEREWVVEISGARAPGEVQLDVQGYELPAGLRLWLGDPATGWKREVHVGETVAIAALAAGRRLTLQANHEGPGSAVVAGLRVMSAYPNPFQQQVGLLSALGVAGDVRVQIHDLQGRLVRTLERRGVPAGESVLLWDGRSANGDTLPPGVYLARYQVAAAQGTVRLVKID